ncbi:MAG: Phosphoserine phosphatase [Methanobacterium sp. PtaU1.Bin242]|nr:MAG: Phosphoserine phosphatase [Methanobacterium sp. PtaU1.Bin242]
MIKLIAFDLDNVLIDGEAIDEMAKLAGVETEISQLTRKAMEGDLDFETSLRERINLLKGSSVDEIKKVVEEIPLMNGTEETIQELKNRGYKLATITGNFEIVANRLKELNFDYIYCNVLHEEEGVLTGEVSGPLMVEGAKANILQEIMDTEKLSSEECAAVGDGANDVSMIQKAGLGVAFNAKPVVKEVADIVVENKDLRELLTIFDKEKTDKTGEDEASKKSESPQIDRDAGKSFMELLDEKKDLEKKLKGFTEERDKLNEEARSFKQLRDDLNASIKENLEKALNYRNQRDEINQEVKKYKKLRDESNQELKKMEWASGRRDIVKIQDEIKKLDKTIETKVLDIRKENELVKKVTDLQKKLQTMKEDEQTKKEALELKELSESYHTKVVELSDQAQETHEQMLKYFQKIDEIRAKADEAHNNFISTREKASQKHEEVKAVLKEIRGKNKGLDKVKAKERYKEDRISEKKNIEEKERAEEIYRKFREGKKLTTDELLLLQKHKIV